jgi:hypothetical protein
VASPPTAAKPAGTPTDKPAASSPAPKSSDPLEKW